MIQPLIAHPIPDVPVVRDRRGFMADACANRTVLHLGCADWPFTAQSLQDGTLLHAKLSKVSARTYGIDLCAEGLAVLRAHGFNHLIQWDAERLDQLTMEAPVDVIVAGEILEHLSNPGLCLQSVSRFMRNTKCRLIISVPNAFSIRHFASFMFRRTERVMPDHTAYYSFTTLSELLRRYNLRICQIHPYTEVSRKASTVSRFAKRVLNATVLRAFPHMSEGIIAVVESADSGCSKAQFLVNN